MKVIIASNNTGKITEFKRILEPLGYQVVSQSEAGIKIQVEETADNFEGNAKLKAEAIYKLTGTACIADDSGLCVDYLDGEPGVYSARYAGENCSSEDNIAKLLKKLEGVPQERRTAHFKCVIHMIISEKDSITVSGECEGNIGTQPVGNCGFGYDPVFMLGEKSFAQLSSQQKDSYSHRGQALNKLNEILQKRGYYVK